MSIRTEALTTPPTVDKEIAMSQVKIVGDGTSANTHVLVDGKKMDVTQAKWKFAKDSSRACLELTIDAVPGQCPQVSPQLLAELEKVVRDLAD
jgi:hypothetical protein